VPDVTSKALGPFRPQGSQPACTPARPGVIAVQNRESNYARSFGYTVSMTAVPLGDARDRLSEYVSEVERTHQRVTITRHGHPAAVLISADDLAAIEETLEVLGTPGAAEAISEGLADAAAGRFADNDALKSRYGIA
jgi:prevent-host-death family protein